MWRDLRKSSWERRTCILDAKDAQGGKTGQSRDTNAARFPGALQPASSLAKSCHCESIVKFTCWLEKEQPEVRTGDHEHAMASFVQIAGPGHDAASFETRLADSIQDRIRVWIFYVGRLLPGDLSQPVYDRQSCSQLLASPMTSRGRYLAYESVGHQAPSETSWVCNARRK